MEPFNNETINFMLQSGTRLAPAGWGPNDKNMKNVLVSIIIPCLNEEKAIGKCVRQIYNVKCTIYNSKINKEVIVVDNGSTDRSREIAKKAGAKVIFEPRKGYGRALLIGMEKAKGDYLIFADGDGSYDFKEINDFIVKLLNGYDLVIGSRLKGNIKKGAMPFFHRYLGTPLLNFFFRLFFKQNISDVNSGFRGISKKAFDKLKLKATGMEFASEMLYKAARKNLTITEVPISYKKRIGESKLSAFRDAWRHLKFMLLFSSTYLFVIPGAFLGMLGILGMIWLLRGKQDFMGKTFDIHTMTVFSFLVLVGFQIVFLGLFAKVFAFNFLEEENKIVKNLLQKMNLEKGILGGLAILTIGTAAFLKVFVLWWQNSFGFLAQERLLIFSLTFMVLGLEIIFSSFFFGIIGKEER